MRILGITACIWLRRLRVHLLALRGLVVLLRILVMLRRRVGSVVRIQILLLVRIITTVHIDLATTFPIMGTARIEVVQCHRVVIGGKHLTGGRALWLIGVAIVLLLVPLTVALSSILRVRLLRLSLRAS